MNDDSSYKSRGKEELVKLISTAAYLFDEGKYHESISYNDKALEIDPKDPIALSNKAACYMELKEYEKALTFLELSLENKLYSASTFYNKAACLSVLGQSEDALLWLERAIKTDSTFAKVAKTDNDFISIRDLPRFSMIVD